MLLFNSFSSFAMNYIEGCERYTYNTSSEKLCMKLQVPVKMSYACYNYTATTNEKFCLKNHKNLTVQKIIDCARYTTSSGAEADCLYPDRSWYEWLTL